MSNVWIALGLTLLAGLATGIGSAIAFFVKSTNYRFLSVATGFSAGVMLYVSFMEILPKGLRALTLSYGTTRGGWINAASFFAGIGLIGVIDWLIPSAKNPHEAHARREFIPLRDPEGLLPRQEAASQDATASDGLHERTLQQGRLLRMGLFTALAIALHNFPEGLATFLAALEDPGLGVAIATAIALHNIPEGISVSVPIFYATGNRRRAFLYSFLSGLAEPVGAGIACIVLGFLAGGRAGVVPTQVMGMLFGGVAGIMVYISLDELLPASRAYGAGHDSLLGLLAGMGLMAVSLLLMA